GAENGCEVPCKILPFRGPTDFSQPPVFIAYIQSIQFSAYGQDRMCSFRRHTKEKPPGALIPRRLSAVYSTVQTAVLMKSSRASASTNSTSTAAAMPSTTHSQRLLGADAGTTAGSWVLSAGTGWPQPAQHCQPASSGRPQWGQV